jgi:hypothetical protein
MVSTPPAVSIRFAAPVPETVSAPSPVVRCSLVERMLSFSPAMPSLNLLSAMVIMTGCAGSLWWA